MADVSEIEAALKLSRNELFEQLGASDDPMFATPEAQRHRGQAFYRNILRNSRETICASVEVKAYLRSDGRHTQKVQVVAAIADLIGGSGAVSCAVLIVQAGLGEICSDEWRSAI